MNLFWDGGDVLTHVAVKHTSSTYFADMHVGNAEQRIVTLVGTVNQ